MKKIYPLLIIILIIFITEMKAQTWNLVWADEFNGTTINTANWKHETGGGGWGNNELENYTNRAVNSTIFNGNLLIIAKKETFGGSNYTSARMKSQDLQFWTYGRIEGRIKLPIGKGIWPAFWMLGQNIGTVGWPKCGELDIMEHINTENLVYGTMHWDNNGHVSYGKSTACNATQYHVYSIEWDADSIKWFLDGNKYVVGNIKNNINSTDELHGPFFILLNMAVGGTWPGNPDGTTVFPDTMFVDYVRVYQKTATNVVNQNDSHLGISVYPNPAGQHAAISYFLPSSAAGSINESEVSISVYNVLGKKVMQLANEKQTEGDHQLNFSTENLQSGLYFIKVSVSGESLTEKLIINKN